MATRQDASTGELSGTPAPAVAPVVGNQETPTGKTMHIKVYSPFKVYYDGQGESLSAVNATGPFDILPRHHNFMTLLTAGEIVIRTGELEHRIRITRGVMHVKADRVAVFLDV